MSEAGLDPAQTYRTNAVKHFKFSRSGPGKRRIHKPPSRMGAPPRPPGPGGEMGACRPWLGPELDRVRPEVIVALGATAGKALPGPSFRVTHDRGTPLPLSTHPESVVVPTIHPSAALRAADDREEVYAGLVSDLRTAAAGLR